MSIESRPHSTTDCAPDMTGFPPAIVALVATYVEELDDIRPEWRRKKPLWDLKFLRRARVKWLLCRTRLLSGRLRDGTPAPRDWQVHVCKSTRDPDECFAHTLSPKDAWNDDMWLPPPLEDAPAAAMSACSLSVTHRLPLDRVEKLLPYMPADVDPGVWLREKIRATGGTL